MPIISQNNRNLLSQIAYLAAQGGGAWSLDALIKSQSGKLKFLGATATPCLC